MNDDRGVLASWVEDFDAVGTQWIGVKDFVECINHLGRTGGIQCERGRAMPGDIGPSPFGPWINRSWENKAEISPALVSVCPGLNSLMS